MSGSHCRAIIADRGCAPYRRENQETTVCSTTTAPANGEMRGAYVRQEVIEEKFSEVLGRLIFDDKVLA